MVRSITVETERLGRNAQGVPFSARFDDVYHSVDGGLAQSRHVFIAGNALPERWKSRDAFTILETGFGLGLNFLAAWDAWRADPGRCTRLHFVSLEKHPLARDDLAASLARFEELAPLARALVASWPPAVAGFHRLAFEGGRVVLTLILGDAREWLPEVEARVDAFFLDGFAPARNPEMWSPEIVRELGRLAATEATLATWTVAGGVRTVLADAGWHIEKREGFASKREMLAGRWPGERAGRHPARDAIVIGAGIAGTLVAESLATRGWQVRLIEARQDAGAHRVGIVRPIVNLRDALNAQASRGAFFQAIDHFRALQRDGYHLAWEPCGVLQVAQDEDEETRFAAIASAHGYPAAFLEVVDRERAGALAGRDVPRGGWWFAAGAVVSVDSLAVASFARAGSGLDRRFGRFVASIEREGRDWRALDRDGRVIAEAPVLVIANAVDAARLIPSARLPLHAVRGQVTFLPADPARKLDIVVSGNGYVAPLPDGGHVVGATYQHEDFDTSVREGDHRANLARVQSLLPGFASNVDATALEGATGFRATVPDRLPIFGATELEGVYVATGLGSRGLLWAPQGADLLACELEGEPLPMPRDLRGAISPKRFLS